jgi:hypothetical protein
MSFRRGGRTLVPEKQALAATQPSMIRLRYPEFPQQCAVSTVPSARFSLTLQWCG